MVDSSRAYEPIQEIVTDHSVNWRGRFFTIEAPRTDHDVVRLSEHAWGGRILQTCSESCVPKDCRASSNKT